MTLRRIGPGPDDGGPKQDVTFIVRHNGQPVEGAVVSISRGVRPLGIALGEGQGEYCKELPHGQYTVQARWRKLGATKPFRIDRKTTSGFQYEAGRTT